MRKVLLALAGSTLLVALALPAGGVAARPATVERLYMPPTSAGNDTICGIDVTVVNSASGVFVEEANGAEIVAGSSTTVFTNPLTGKSIELTQSGVATSSAPLDNGDGTFTSIFKVNGTSPKIQIVGGQPITIDTGSITFSITTDASGHFLSFDVVSVKGPRPAGGCDAIVAALT
jgi:hypothetical protein